MSLLSYLIFIPILAALLAILIPARLPNSFRVLSLTISIIQVIILILIVNQYTFGSGFQLIEKIPWITLELGTWGILKAEYFVALDGLSSPMVALSVGIMLVATISSWTIDKNQKGYFILLLILNGAIIGSFCALDFLLFYVFFEFMLLPMYFLIGIWGGPKREYASIKFFLYTLLGSILILLVFVGLYLSVKTPDSNEQVVHTFNVLHMQDSDNLIPGSLLSLNSDFYLGPYSFRLWAFLLLFIGFIIKLPAVPFHTWLPDAHVEAPTPISVILAALLLKFGGYGLLRFAYPIFPDGAIHFSWLVGFIGLVSIIYGALNAMASRDLKRLIAYSSVSHMGFVLLGIASSTVEGITGAVYQMFSHGIISAMLFLIAGVLYDRTHDRLIENYSGLATKMKAYTAFVLIAFFASMGLPGFAGFMGEVMIFFGAFQSQSVNGLVPAWMAITATLGLLLGAAYYLWTIQRMFYGTYSVRSSLMDLTDLDRREFIMLLPLALAALIFGILPQLLLNYINPFATDFTSTWFSFEKLLTP
ncbi:MAG TPA: NADH-quinone oxidoreductase subunit M [Cyclobacteriaceae bacterium]|nr:NADH-quinone oxidoreductase subunit M [Cyclobacteriaceae bacterium]HPW62941.1 NADH-quinone oxidoreductase subunit M [Cyclobacteriaceae bacterium]